MDISEFTVENMTPLVGSKWVIEIPGGQTFELELMNVVKAIDKHIDSRLTRDSFAMRFLGPVNVYLPQATYTMTNEQVGGAKEIFIVPTGREAGRYAYEAIFG